MSEQRQRKRQRQQEKKKKRSLHDKHKMRRKKDVAPNLPFIIGYLGDPAQRFFCEDVHEFDGRHSYGLIGNMPECAEKRFTRLVRYMKHKITRIAVEGKVLIYKAGVKRIVLEALIRRVIKENKSVFEKLAKT